MAPGRTVPYTRDRRRARVNTRVHGTAIPPGRPIYALGAPRLRRTELAFENGRTLIVEGAGVDKPGAIYVQSVSFNGARLLTPFIEHGRLLQGGTLRFDMDTTPNPQVYQPAP